MTNSRQEFAETLGDTLNADEAVVWNIVDNPNSLGTLDPSVRGTVQVVRQSFEPNAENPQGDYLETFDVWVVSSTDEDNLDELAQDVTDAIDASSKHWWTKADRQQHPEGHRAYKITANAVTEKE